MKNIKEYDICGFNFKFEDFTHSCVRDGICSEIFNDTYKINKIPFKEGDIVFDIGANIGMVSIFLAKKFPFLKIYSFEALPENYESLLNNIKLNEIHNIKAYNVAVYKDSCKMKFIMRPDNTGGGTMNSLKKELDDHFIHDIECKSLDQILNELCIDKIKFMKIDCEGSEYDIFYNSKQINKIEYLSSEFHVNQNLKSKGYSPIDLLEHLKKHIKCDNISYFICEMTE
jgi:FkbM family methyltransferase